MLAVVVCAYVGFGWNTAMTVAVGPIYGAVGIFLCCN